ncbi:hypothetical protein EST32_15660 [Lactiplantibacillus plantarum]|uniref:hypothetical protein n=1 Tax=Leuconostoc inhae TaxID=178001 RepID=UPI0002466877|nr:hypothetical protein [Leuconostoc inhae]RXS45077.1 hypothetical protein EST32_15660 [Lactiplantibacillus plantarum]CCF27666.1 Putative uncharacterized protein [Leuconostoc citreum LBAE C11]STQ48542.1 Uncharacterised protein [Enterococcus durans]STQ48560.1 Uncharacterised protein [Enterococcus durans]STQ48576.1 Uncharacterised protein [Enterococcus durans]
MSRQKRSIKENNDKLKVQLELLRSCTEHFDSGMIHMALPMATQFRVLIHQTDKTYTIFRYYFRLILNYVYGNPKKC